MTQTLRGIDVLQLAPLPEPAYSTLVETFTVHDARPSGERERLTSSIGERVRAIVAGGPTVIDAALLDRLPSLEIIASRAAGVDKIDLDRARSRGIVVTNGSQALAGDVAELALGLMLAVSRGMLAADRFVRSGSWERGEQNPAGTTDVPLLPRVSGKTIGILGLGAIGSAIARRAAAMDMRVLYTKRHKRDDVPYEFVRDVHDLAAEADFLVVACAGGRQTHHLVDARVLAALGASGYLINIARGSVVDQDSLIAALGNGGLAGAGLDVFEEEPKVPEALRGMSNVVLSPHAASHTRDSKIAQGKLVLNNLIEHFSGRPVSSQVK